METSLGPTGATAPAVPTAAAGADPVTLASLDHMSAKGLKQPRAYGSGRRWPTSWLTLVDDGGSRDTAVQAYTEWIDGIDLLVGPYSSGLVRAVAPWYATSVGCSGTTADPPTI